MIPTMRLFRSGKPKLSATLMSVALINVLLTSSDCVPT